MIALLRLEHLLVFRRIETFTVGIYIDDIVLVEGTDGLEERGERGIERRVGMGQIDRTKTIGQCSVLDAVEGAMLLVLAFAGWRGSRGGHITEEVVAQGSEYLPMLTQLQEVLGVEAVGIVMRHGRFRKLAGHVAHAVRVIDGDMRVETRSLHIHTQVVATVTGAVECH